MTPEGVMDYIKVQANQKTGKYLSTSSYTGKRSAIHHLVCCHWGQNGWSEAFTTGLDALWKGFTHRSTEEKSSNRRRQKAKRKWKKKTGALIDKDDGDKTGDDDGLSEDEAEERGDEEEKVQWLRSYECMQMVSWMGNLQFLFVVSILKSTYATSNTSEISPSTQLYI